MKEWISGAWEVTTSGDIEDGIFIRFTVHNYKWERLAFKCDVNAELNRKGSEFEINLVHKKVIPWFIEQTIRDMANEVIQEAGVKPETIPKLINLHRHRIQPWVATR